MIALKLDREPLALNTPYRSSTPQLEGYAWSIGVYSITCDHVVVISTLVQIVLSCDSADLSKCVKSRLQFSLGLHRVIAMVRTAR